MQTIYKPNEARIALGEARQLIWEVTPQETWGKPVWEGGEGWPPPGVDYELVDFIHSIHYGTLTKGLIEVLAELNISPAFKYCLPWKDFNESSDIDSYVITHDEFVALAKYCDVIVVVGEKPPADPPREEAGRSSIAHPVRWTEKVIEEARERAAKTSIAAAAAHYGVKRQRLSSILSKGSKKQAKAKTPNAFTGLGRRS